MILRPTVRQRGRYPRAHLERVSLRLDKGTLIATDDRGREHRLPLDGTDGSPASIGVVAPSGLLRQFAYRHGLPAYFVVLDNRGRLLIEDSYTTLWPAATVRRFAAAAGLRYLGYGPTRVGANRGRAVVRLDTKRRRSWAVLGAMILFTVPLPFLIVAVGLPTWLAVVATLAVPTAGSLFLMDAFLGMVSRKVDHTP